MPSMGNDTKGESTPVYVRFLTTAPERRNHIRTVLPGVSAASVDRYGASAVMLIGSLTTACSPGWGGSSRPVTTLLLGSIGWRGQLEITASTTTRIRQIG